MLVLLRVAAARLLDARLRDPLAVAVGGHAVVPLVVVLSGDIAKVGGLDHCRGALVSKRTAGSQEGKTRDARFDNLVGAFTVPGSREKRVEGRDILLVDDVMTSGATFAAATEALLAAGAHSVSVLCLARVAKDG